MHCKATHSDPKWRALRQQIAADKSKPAAAAAASSSATSSSSLSAAATSTAPSSRGEQWSCERIMREVQQVWPVEQPEPHGLLKTVQLKPCEYRARFERAAAPPTPPLPPYPAAAAHAKLAPPYAELAPKP